MRGELNKGDAVRHQKLPHMGGIVQKVEQDKYVAVRQADGQTVTFLKKFLVRGHPELLPAADGGLPEDISKYRDGYIEQYRKTSNSNLWIEGGCIRQFIAFGKFLKWVDTYRGTA